MSLGQDRSRGNRFEAGGSKEEIGNYSEASISGPSLRAALLLIGDRQVGGW